MQFILTHLSQSSQICYSVHSWYIFIVPSTVAETLNTHLFLSHYKMCYIKNNICFPSVLDFVSGDKAPSSISNALAFMRVKLWPAEGNYSQNECNGNSQVKFPFWSVAVLYSPWQADCCFVRKCSFSLAYMIIINNYYQHTYRHSILKYGCLYQHQ